MQQCNKCSFHSRLVCQLCKMRGHGVDHCPDKWRRYHSTVIPINHSVQKSMQSSFFFANRLGQILSWIAGYSIGAYSAATVPVAILSRTADSGLVTFVARTIQARLCLTKKSTRIAVAR